MKIEPTSGNKTDFMGLSGMFEALMTRLDQVDENYKSINAKMEGISQILGNLEMKVNKQLENVDEKYDAVKGKIEKPDENAKILSWKIDKSSVHMDENYKLLNAKMDENHKSLNAAMEESLKTLNDKMEKKFEEVLKVLSNLENPVNKHSKKLDNVARNMEKIEVNAKSLSAKIEETSKTLDEKRENKIDEIEQTNLESPYEQLQEISEVLSTAEVHVHQKRGVVEKECVQMEENPEFLWVDLAENLNTREENEEMKSKKVSNIAELQLNKELEKVEAKCHDVKEKIEKLDENVKVVSMKIDENAQSFKANMDEMEKKLKENQEIHLVSSNMVYHQLQDNSKVLSKLETQGNKQLENVGQMCADVGGKVEKMHETTKSLSMKIDENNVEMEKKLKENQEIQLESSNTTKEKLQEISKVLSSVEVQVNKQFEMAKEKSMEMAKSNKIISSEQTCDGGVTRKLNISQEDKDRLEWHKNRLKNGFQLHHRTDKEKVLFNYQDVGLSLKEIDDLFSTVPVPDDFRSFLIVILRKTNSYIAWNNFYDFTYFFKADGSLI